MTDSKNTFTQKQSNTNLWFQTDSVNSKTGTLKTAKTTSRIGFQTSLTAPYAKGPVGRNEKNETFQANISNQTTKKKYYTSYSKLSEVKLVTIGIASPLRILQWAEKTLPNGKIYGEVLNANTLHHKTFKPQIGGLFCERIFGPLKDFECACENTKMNKLIKQEMTRNFQLQKNNFASQPTGLSLTDSPGSESKNSGLSSQNVKALRKFCPKCDVEYTWSVIRRYQLGYIKLSSPVTHIWFLKGTPSYLSLLLDMKKRHLQLVTYCSETLTLENALAHNKSNLLDSPSKIFASWEALWAPQTIEVKPPKQKNQYLERIDIKPTRFDWKQSQFNDFKAPSERTFAAELGPLGPSAPTGLDEPMNSNNVVSQKISKSAYTRTHLNRKTKVKFLNQVFKDSRNQMAHAQTRSEIHRNTPTQTLKQLPVLLSALQLSINYNSLVQRAHETGSSRKEFRTNQVHLKKSPDNNYKYGKGTTLVIEKTFDLNFLPTFEIHEGTDQLQDHSKKLMISRLTKIIQNLPLDHYILCSIEKRLHKKVILHSIIQTWQTLYKKSYNQAMLKLVQLGSKNSTAKDFEMSQTTLLKSENQTNAGSSPGEGRIQNLIYMSAMERLRKVMKLVKTAFQKHVSMTLKQLKDPIFLLKYTTDINNSSFDILVKSTQELEQFFKVDSIFFVNVMVKSFLRPLLINRFSSIQMMHIVGSPKAPSATQGASVKLNSASLVSQTQTELSAFEFNRQSNETIELKSTQTLKKALYSLKKQSVDLKNEFELLKSSNFETRTAKKRDVKMTFVQNSKFNRSLLKGFYQKHIPLTKNEFLHYLNDFNKNKNGLKFSGPTVFNQFSSESSLLRAPLFEQTKARNTLASPQTGLKPRIYNNVYTLSHRERWESEKDWQIFLLYNSFSPVQTFSLSPKQQESTTVNDKIDTPIFAYQSRVFNFVNLTSLGDSYNIESKNVLNSSTKEFMNSNALGISQLSSAFFSGPGIIQQLLNELTFPELKKLDKQNRLVLYQLNQNILKLKKQVKIFVYDKSAQLELKDLCKRRDLLIRRTKLVRKLFRKDSNPSSMILTILPVLPPDLRPIVKMGSQIAASDLNRLYQQVIYRNDRLKFFLKDPATSNSYEMKYAQRLLQEAVDNLIQNSKSGTNSEKDSRGRALKSLSDVLKGKQGRFRQFLLGKRVDYSGRSVIVVGPKLKLHECGLPVEMALELYLPFLLKRILNKNYAKTVIGAKALIKNNIPLAHELLREIMQVSPVLLNRAPTLHRLGIQAFVPRLVEGRAILLHPLVCSAFNADFDGDQMAVHVPITVEARAEAWKLMLARNNILSPATGEPLAIPSQDMVLGCYYLTTYSKSLQKKNTTNQMSMTVVNSVNANYITTPTELFNYYQSLYFKNLQDVINAYNEQKIKVHTLVWVQWNGEIENGNDLEEPVEVRLTPFGQWQEITANYHRFYDANNVLINQYMATTPGRILFNLILQNI